MVSLIKQTSKSVVMSYCFSLSCSQVSASPNICAEPHHYHNQSHHQPPVKEDAADIIMSDGRLLGAGGHAERPQEVVDQDVELLDVFGLGLQHAEHYLVSLPHAFSVG